MSDNNDNDKTEASNNITTVPLSCAVVTSSTEIARTKWLSLETLQWSDPHGVTRAWDCASRTTKTNATGVDAVIIIPLLRDPSDPSRPVETILVEQFRPPVRSITLEFPAGLIDADETAPQAALRELREETGYVGEACRTMPMVSPRLCMSPGMCNEVVQVVVVDVDLSNPYNHGTPKPQLDAGEFCSVRRVTLQEGMQQILSLQQQQQPDTSTSKDNNPMPIMGLYLFAMGWEMGRRQASQEQQQASQAQKEHDQE